MNRFNLTALESTGSGNDISPLNNPVNYYISRNSKCPIFSYTRMPKTNAEMLRKAGAVGVSTPQNNP